MANAYKTGKWSGTLQADLVGDKNKTTPTLGDDYDVELQNLKKAQSNINSIIKKIKKEISSLKNHAETGKMATYYLGQTEKRLDKIANSVDTEVKLLTNNVNQAHKDEWNRMKRLLEQWAAQQQSH